MARVRHELSFKAKLLTGPLDELPCRRNGSQSTRRADRRANAFNRIPMTPAASGAAMKLAGTQKAARRMEACARLSDSPPAFATRPAEAAPNARPAC